MSAVCFLCDLKCLFSFSIEKNVETIFKYTIIFPFMEYVEPFFNSSLFMKIEGHYAEETPLLESTYQTQN